MGRVHDVNRQELVSRYNSGVGLTALQKEFGINKMTIRNILVEMGVPIRGRGRPRKSPVVTEEATEETTAPSYGVIGKTNPTGSF